MAFFPRITNTSSQCGITIAIKSFDPLSLDASTPVHGYMVHIVGITCTLLVASTKLFGSIITAVLPVPGARSTQQHVFQMLKLANFCEPK